MLIDNIKTVAVIVTYNRLPLLKECIEALVGAERQCDILIVNNSSSDGTDIYLNNLQNNYRNNKFYIFNLKENLNGAGGYNFGIKEALKLEYKYFWLMDDDCIVDRYSLKILEETAEYFNNDFGFLSSKVLWTNGDICLTNIQRTKVARKVHNFIDKYVKADFCSFVSCFVKKADVKNIGLPIKEFIIWTDDLEWTRRLTYKKLYSNASQGYLCNESIVTHKCKENFGVTIVKDSDDRFPRYKYIYRNDVYCFRREGLRGHIYMLIRNIFHIVKIILFSKTKKIERIKTLICGYIEGYKFNPQIEYI